MKNWQILIGLVVLPCLAGLSGCGGQSDGLPREAVSGTVRVGDQPLAQGTVMFTPVASGADAVQVAGRIEEGSFSIPRSEGPTPGTYRVMIIPTQKVAPAPEAAYPEDEDPALAKAATVSNIPAQDGFEAVVKAGGPNRFEFTLKPNP
ncbi:hypothetical protein Isop_3598 [Isosphaera pallida ATCC 43644]|uniref:Carboxypeptidase regulatory-like domain-containing protein n=1 Tax=Isosphaera pallida (strain ATCC 43644 / DSM 9630 / IS1B) TaxID=575540 RepID=E8QYH2_ISOPI|nr:hypothetical protein [Isosphaera pallida]ADV64155.1 hypothetical protein Isop_3598 [Isosphaera pallida ATCC 43644]